MMCVCVCVCVCVYVCVCVLFVHCTYLLYYAHIKILYVSTGVLAYLRMLCVVCKHAYKHSFTYIILGYRWVMNELLHGCAGTQQWNLFNDVIVYLLM